MCVCAYTGLCLCHRLRLWLHNAQCIFRVSGTNCRQAALLARLPASLSLSPSVSLYACSSLSPCFRPLCCRCVFCGSSACPHLLLAFAALVDHLTLFPLCLRLSLCPSSVLPPLFLPFFLSLANISRIFLLAFPLECCETKAKVAFLSQVQPQAFFFFLLLYVCVCVGRMCVQWSHTHTFSMQLFANENEKLSENCKKI